MVASRVADAEDPALTRQRAYCASLREALQAIPGAAPAAGETGPSGAASAGETGAGAR